MTFGRTAKVISSIALVACICGVIFLKSVVQSIFQKIEEENIQSFLYGKATIYKGFDSAVLPY